ncbi:hypothetical protein DRN69_04280 [Candidatus Pacearchaeota archaeon]|nr:MAG: hypothetical protein DRN69_04280 [Candidatus Pacearchaeota archaeon]
MKRSIGYTFYYPKYLSVEEDGRCYTARCPYCKNDKLRWKNWFLAKIEKEELKAECEECKMVLEKYEIEKGKYLGERKELWEKRN